jgi:hypothetical protein
MTSFKERMDDAESYNELVTVCRTLTPSQVLRVRELIHLVKNGRRILAHAPTCIQSGCSCGLEKS